MNNTIVFPVNFDEEMSEELKDKTPVEISEEFLEEFKRLCVRYRRTIELVPSIRIAEIKKA